MFKSLLQGAAWSVALAWLSRLIGLFSILIVARILTPDDYGVVAIAMIVMFFIQNISSAGTSQYLIQKKDLDVDDVRTSWTLVILFRIFYSVVLFFSSGMLSDYFDEPRLEDVFQLLSLVPIIDAFKNISLFLEEKNLNYKPVFILGLLRKIIALAVSVSLAISGYGYWSLIYAELVGCLIFVLFSYVYLPINSMHFRPTLRKLSDQFSFYSWSFMQVFIGFAKSKIDGLLLAKYVGSSGMGQYHLSSSLADMTSNELSTPITRPLYAGLAKYEKDSDSQIQMAYKSLASIALTVFFLSFLLATTSIEVVGLLLGNNWRDIPPIVSILSVAYALSASGALYQRLLTVQGKVKHVFYLDCISLVVISALVGIAAFYFRSLEAISWSRLLSAMIVLAVSSAFTARYTSLRFINSLKCVLPAFLIAVLSSLLSMWIASFAHFDVFFMFLFKSALYVLFYVFGFCLWCVYNRFENDEWLFVGKLFKLILGRNCRV